MSNIMFIHHKVLMCKMQEGDFLLDHVNKVKTLACQLVCLEIHLRDEDIIKTLLESLPSSFENLIIIVEIMLMKELTMDYIIVHLMHKMLKCNENEL